MLSLIIFLISLVCIFITFFIVYKNIILMNKFIFIFVLIFAHTFIPLIIYLINYNDFYKSITYKWNLNVDILLIIFNTIVTFLQYDKNINDPLNSNIFISLRAKAIIDKFYTFFCSYNFILSILYYFLIFL
jgi:hypothetical protein